MIERNYDLATNAHVFSIGSAVNGQQNWSRRHRRRQVIIKTIKFVHKTDIFLEQLFAQNNYFKICGNRLCL